jgi:hypothetical protein
VSKPRDFQAFNAEKPVATVRFACRADWLLVVHEAARRGLTLSTYLRTVAIEGANSGRQQNHQQANRALATKRSA